jgi:hypothetical protein
MKKIVLLFVLISSYTYSQTINDYEYVLVPSKFNIFKEKDKYRTSTNTKLLLQKYGFKSFFITDSIPAEIANTNCNKLYADLVNDNSFFMTKVKIVLKDCQDKIVYETDFGASREKQYITAYNQALREAGKSFEKLNYKYNGKNNVEIGTAVATSSVITSDVPSTNNNSLSDNNSEIFYFAQPIANGYQIVDTEPKVIMKLYNTSQPTVFMAVKGTINGTVISKNGQWFFEYYDNGKLVSELLKLKF